MWVYTLALSFFFVAGHLSDIDGHSICTFGGEKASRARYHVQKLKPTMNLSEPTMNLSIYLTTDGQTLLSFLLAALIVASVTAYTNHTMHSYNRQSGLRVI